MRKYSGEQDLIWGGDKDCQHEWEVERTARPNSSGGKPSETNPYAKKRSTHGVDNYSEFAEYTDRATYTNTCSLCGAWRGAYGLEPTPESFVAHTIEILREIRRVLRKDGVCFLNIGDSYWGSAQGYGTSNPTAKQASNVGTLSTILSEREPLAKGKHNTLKPKDLCLIPFRVAIAAQEDGWWVRSDIIWSKPNPMPESVTDRPTNSHEYILMLTKSGTSQYWTHSRKRGTRTQPKPDYIWTHKRSGLVVDYQPVSDRIVKKFWARRNLWQGHDYYFDADAVREPHQEASIQRDKAGFNAAFKGRHTMPGEKRPHSTDHNGFNNPAGRNIRSVWTFPTQPYPEAHFAVFPEALPERCIKAATPEVGCCSKCGAPWVRILSKGFTSHDAESKTAYTNEEGHNANQLAKLRQAARASGGEYQNTKETIGWQPTCSCNADKVPSIVLDPFAGAGTTLLSACKLNRHAVGYELSGEYCQMTEKRLLPYRYGLLV